MRYKKIKNKQKSHSIPTTLITDKKFNEIVNILNKKSELTNQDRYLYGYSLLRTQQQLESLITLWPLSAKGHTKIQEDCTVIAAHVFNDENFLSMPLPDEALYTLFQVARNLAPHSLAYRTLQQRLFDSLWFKKDYEKLERTLKANKNEFSGIYVENLSKLAFFNPENKLISNTPAFISLILSGGACLISRNPIYHNDIADEIRLLANEIKLLYSQLNTKHKFFWDKSLFENFVDYEASVLSQVLQLAIKINPSNLDIIPSPSYIMTYDSTTGRVSQDFLPWLASANEDLFEMYNPNTHQAVLWALGEEKSPAINEILKSGHQNKLHPYLRLALMLRSTSNPKTYLSIKKIVKIKDFKNTSSTSLFKNVAIQTVRSMLKAESKIDLSPEFWIKLLEFYPVLQEPEFKNILITKSIYKLHEEYENQTNLSLSTAKSIACQLKDKDFEKLIDDLYTRQQECSQFLLNLKDKKNAAKNIRNIKDEPTLRTYVTLIADTFCVAYTKLSKAFFQHIKSLIKNKRINKLIPLKDFFDYDLGCNCLRCERDFYSYKILHIIEALNLPAARLPDAHYKSNSQPMETQAPKISILSQTDPFKILDISYTDSKQNIMQKVMKLIQQSPGQMAVFRQAQNELFNPGQRFLHQYFRFLAYKNAEAEVRPFSPPVNTHLYEIPLRNEFLNAPH